MSKLSLGPIAKADIVKLSLALPVRLKDDLEHYAALHAKTWDTEKMDIAALVPHILTAFLARDRGFRKARSTRSIRSLPMQGLSADNPE